MLINALIAAVLFSVLTRPQAILYAWRVSQFVAALALFLFVFVGPASVGFARKLSAAAAGAAALTSVYALLQMFGIDLVAWESAGTPVTGTLTNPRALGVFCAAALPLALSLAADASENKLLKRMAGAAALLCALVAGLMLIDARPAAMPAFRFSLAPAAAGRAGDALALLLSCAGMYLAVREARRRSKDGDRRAAALLFGHAAACAVLLAGFFTLGLKENTALFALYWMLLGSAVGLAYERGGSIVAAVVIPASPALRRFLYLPAVLIAGLGLTVSLSAMSSDCLHNNAVSLAARGRGAQAVSKFDAVPLWHPQGLHARYLAANLVADDGAQDSLTNSLRRYAKLQSIAPHYRRIDFRQGAVLAKLHRPQSAEEKLLAAVSVFPRDPEAYRLLVEISTDLGKNDQAHEAALALVGIAPDNARHWHILAEQYQQRGRGDLARKMLDRAAKINDYARAPLK
jgi:tetratricopeptide (TPR) repeat protein